MSLIRNTGIFICMLCFGFMLPVSAQSFALQVKKNVITYTQDAKGNRILDFSYCGYKSSEQDIPDLKNVIFVPHIEGDASDIIQRAINYVSGLKPDSKGFRGAVL